MSDENGLLVDATARILLIENPADQVKLPPPPPAAAIESTEMWRPADQAEAMDRIPLSGQEQKEAASAFGIWLGVSALHAAVMDALPKRRVEPLDRLHVQDEDDDDDEK